MRVITRGDLDGLASTVFLTVMNDVTFIEAARVLSRYRFGASIVDASETTPSNTGTRQRMITSIRHGSPAASASQTLRAVPHHRRGAIVSPIESMIGAPV